MMAIHVAIDRASVLCRQRGERYGIPLAAFRARMQDWRHRDLLCKKCRARVRRDDTAIFRKTEGR